jgi:sugar/nucleoside kinase (ribokinase family)
LIGTNLMAPFDILVAGEINPDLILTGDVIPSFNQVEKLVDSAVLTIGSSSVIFACGAARLGMKVSFIGVCGDDIFGRFMVDEMQKHQIDTSHIILRKGGHTGMSVILNQNADRAILTYPGLIRDLSSNDVSDELLKQNRHIHVASYFLQTRLQSGLTELFSRARDLGLTTSLDPNFDPAEKWAGFDELLYVTNVFLPNLTEALSISKTDDVESASKQLAKKTGIAVVKLGSQGALACTSNSLHRVSSILVGVIDTVGAGDSFDAGFIYGYLNDWNVDKSLRLGCVCGALSTKQAGGIGGQPTLKEAMNHVSN